MNAQEARDSALLGYLEYEDFLQKFDAEWNSFDIQIRKAESDQKVIALWDAMPADRKTAMRAANPKAYDVAEKLIKELRKEYENSVSTSANNGSY